MGQQQKRQEFYILFAYLCMLLTMCLVVPCGIAYWLGAKIAHVPDVEVWLNSHAFWIIRSLLIFIVIAVFAALWFTPLFFVPWDYSILTKATTIIGSIFALIAELFLLNAWLKGVVRYFRKKPVY